MSNHYANKSRRSLEIEGDTYSILMEKDYIDHDGLRGAIHHLKNLLERGEEFVNLVHTAFRKLIGFVHEWNAVHFYRTAIGIMTDWMITVMEMRMVEMDFRFTVAWYDRRHGSVCATTRVRGKGRVTLVNPRKRHDVEPGERVIVRPPPRGARELDKKTYLLKFHPARAW